MRSIRTSSVLVALLLGAAVHPQFTDDFSDGEFTTDPTWSGSTALFIVDAGRLRSQSPGAANYYLSTPSAQAIDAQWDFYVNLKFATSGANYADIYLTSSSADLQSGVNGYFVRIGGTQDRVELFRSDAGVATSLLSSPDGIVNSSSDNPFRIRVTRGSGDVWTLSYDDGALGTFTVAGSMSDATYNTSTAFGIRIEQSSAAGPVNNHFFDDFVVGDIVLDTAPPQVLAVEVIDPANIDVIFDEPVDQTTSEDISNYEVQPFLNATSAVRDGVDLARVHLTLTFPLTSGNNYVLLVDGVEDLSGNAIVNAQFPFDYVVPDEAQFRDVVINEIMADPTPVVGLPDAEFIELHNPTPDKTFDLAGWTISDGGTPANIPSTTLAPGGYVILTTTALAAQFTGFGTVLGVPSFPSLNNAGDPLTLRDGNGLVIDAVTYALSWYNDAVKDDGGWTLEQKDPTAPCSGAGNWTASSAPLGGTPGAQNSVFAIVPDTVPPALVSMQVNSATELVLVFNELLDGSSTIAALYSITPNVAIAQVSNGPEPLLSVILTLADPLVIGQAYTITVNGVTDCTGNPIGGGNTLPFALPEPVAVGDVVINEVLYDPRVGGSDFVELYNRSDKVLSLAGWRMANEVNGAIANSTVITNEAILLLPGEYILLTEAPANIAAEYPRARTERFLLCDLPSYNNGNGTVVFQDPQQNTLDLFRYDDDLHFALINDVEGVSLERVDPDRPSSDNTNWQSAAEPEGWGTPGYRNSAYAPAPQATGEMTIDPAIFSPDNDGHQDLLTITYRFNAPGFVGNMTVYDLAGREVKRLMENVLLSTEGAISWDGIMTGGDKARIGPYVVLFEVFDLEGDVETYKATVVLAHFLD